MDPRGKALPEKAKRLDRFRFLWASHVSFLPKKKVIPGGGGLHTVAVP